MENADERLTPKAPVRESLSDFLCPKCGNYLSFDPLNDYASDAPNFCSVCGQPLNWEGVKARGKGPCPHCGKVELVCYLAGSLRCAACWGEV